jgi:hypothetical protein
MEYELVITREYIDKGLFRLFNIKRQDGQLIDLYNNLVSTLATINIDKIPEFLKNTVSERAIQLAEYTFIHFGELIEGDVIEVSKGCV